MGEPISGGASGSSGRAKNASTPNVAITSQTQGALDLQREYFGRELSANELGGLVGAQDNSTLEIVNYGNQIAITVKNEHIKEQLRFIEQDYKGNLFIKNYYFETNPGSPPGFGTKVFTDQVNAARAMGVKYIKTGAEGDNPKFNGYYTWPRLGYDGELWRAIELAKIPKKIRKGMKSDTIQELFKTPEGRNWWKKNGTTIQLQFDLDPNSISSKVLDAYNEERKKRSS
jgi:hypothetical protein